MGHITCDKCREQMCTDNLLSNLRCAECRQIKFEQSYEFALKASLFALGGMLGWLLGHHSDSAVRHHPRF
jgi:hypothetical protein